MDDHPHLCPVCGASSRERVLMQFFSIATAIVEFIHHML